MNLTMRRAANCNKYYAIARGISNDEAFLQFFLKKKSRSTAQIYENELKKFFTWVKKPVKQIRHLHLQQYKETLGHYAPATQRRILNTLKAFFSLANKTGYIKGNPAQLLPLPKVEVTSFDHFLTQEEVSRLLAALQVNQRDFVIGMVLITTGIRVGELVKVCWKDFFIGINGHVGLVVKGKGDKERVVKIRRDVWAEIIKYRRSLGLSDDTIGADNSPFLVNRKGGRLSDRYVRMIIKKAGEKAGIRKQISPHWLRHTSASLALLGGASVKQVQAQLGHSSIVITERYLHNISLLEDAAADYINFSIPRNPK